MKCVLFAGPSIAGIDRSAFAEIDVRPPAVAGDVLNALFDGAAVIGLVDGVFDGQPSVWHKEILAVISAGATMLGASSLGALRAAECSHYGMIGIGRIFRDYRDGVRTSDADVALLHATEELGFAPITVPLVDADATLNHQDTRETLGAEECDKFLQIARRTHYRDRTWSEVLSRRNFKGDQHTDLQVSLKRLQINQKSSDALELIEQLKAYCRGQPRARNLVNGPFSRTELYATLEQRVRFARKNIPKA